MVTIEDLHKSFGELDVIKGLDLSVKKGEVVSIIGPSGTGKSTLLRCLNYLERPEKGRITIGDVTVDAEDHTKDQVRKLRQQSAMIFQNYNLFNNKDALHNVMEPLVTAKKMDKEQAEEVAREYLRKVGMDELRNKYPITLSGGQQQRVAIARSIAIQPSVLLFDEPTSALDPEWVNEVLEVIEDLAREHFTMIIVTHEIQFARDVSDRIVFMENGNIVEQGTPEQVIDAPKNARTRDFLNREEGRRFRIVSSRNFHGLLPIFVECGLEMSLEDETPENLVTCLELINRNGGDLVGGAAIVEKDGNFILKAIAVKPEFQGQKLGTKLVKCAISEVKRRGGSCIWLSAKVPEFYKKMSFSVVPRDEAPDVSSCLECPRYGKTCNSEIMKYEWHV